MPLSPITLTYCLVLPDNVHFLGFHAFVLFGMSFSLTLTKWLPWLWLLAVYEASLETLWCPPSLWPLGGGSQKLRRCRHQLWIQRKQLRQREMGDVPCLLVKVFPTVLFTTLAALSFSLGFPSPWWHWSKVKIHTKKLFAFLLPPLCFPGCATSSILVPPVQAGWLLSAAGTALCLGSPMQTSSIYHSASGCSKERKRDKPLLQIVKEKLILIWGPGKSAF